MKTEYSALVDAEVYPKGEGSAYTATVNTVKAIVGTGILTLPYAMKCSGLVNGLIAFCSVGLYSTYSMWLISECFRLKPHVSTYEQLCETALGSFGRIIGAINIILLEVLVGAGYLVFVGVNFASVVDSLSATVVMLGCAPVILAFIFNRTVNSLGFISQVGNFAIVASLAVILYYASINTEGRGTYELGGDIGGLAVFLGSTVFMFSGHAEVVAIVKPMADRSEYLKVLLTSVGFLFVIYMIFGIVVYVSFGEVTDGLIFNNMSGTPVSITKIFHSLAILFSIPVKLWPAFEAIELYALGQDWQEMPTTGLAQHIASIVIRCSVLTAMLAVAIGVPDFAFLVAFCGSFCISLVGLVLPPLVYILLTSKARNSKEHLSTLGIIIHWILFLIGVGVCSGSSGQILYTKLVVGTSP